MAETILFGIAEEVLNKLGSKALNEIASAWGFKTQLKKLKNTINSLKAVLLDAEERQADSLAVRSWLERLSIVVYVADDLFDEFNAVAARKQLMGERKLAEEEESAAARKGFCRVDKNRIEDAADQLKVCLNKWTELERLALARDSQLIFR